MVWNVCNSHFRVSLTFPDQSQKSARMSDNPVKQEVENFNRRSLKKTETKMNTNLPTKEGKWAPNISSAQSYSFPSTAVAKDIFGYCEVHAQLPFTLSFLFCYQDASEKGSDL